MSTTSSAALCPTVPTGQIRRSLKACARLDLLEVFEVVVPEHHVPREGVEPPRLEHLVARLEFRGLRTGDELGEVSMAGPAAVRHRLVDDPCQRGVGQLEAHFLSDLPTEPVIRPLSALEQPARRKPRAAPGLPPDADEDDGPASIVDQATGSPKRRAASSTECGIVRWSDPGTTDDGNPTKPVEGVPHPILALSGTHRRSKGWKPY